MKFECYYWLFFAAFKFCFGNDCNRALLDDASLSATSVFGDDRGPEKARLNGNGAWTAKSSDFSQFLTINLKEKRNITSIATQGRPFTSEFVQEFRIEYGNNDWDYADVKDREGYTKLFHGNTDGDTIKYNEFDTPIIAQYIRINPTRWGDRISLRVELYGCEYIAETMNFDGSSYAVLDLSRRVVASHSDTIRFRFRTNLANGVVLYSRGTQHDFFALQLVDNQLLLNIDLGGEGVTTSVSAGSLLDDNLWHDVLIYRHDKEVAFTVDRLVVREKIRGEFTQLDLDRELFVGGVPNFNQEGLIVLVNFTGCLENLYINQTNFIEELQENRHGYYKPQGNIIYTCTYQQVIPVTFPTAESHIRVNGYNQKFMNSSFDFRTFNEDGMLFYNKFFSDGYIKLFLLNGKMKVEFKSKNTPVVIIQPFDEILNDGSWHRTMIILQENRMEVHLNGKPSITTRQFTITTGPEYKVGGGLYGSQGFVGCMRYIYIENRYINVKSLPVEMKSPELIIDACQMLDRCNPNPCEHSGSCKQTWNEFTCDCGSTGYSGAVCHTSRHPLSCEAYKIDNPKSRDVNLYIDVDGSGPLDAFPVGCEFPVGGEISTILHHKNERPTEVKGFPRPGSFIQDIVYDADLEQQIVHVVNRSYVCKQMLSYDCLRAHLFNSPQPENEVFTPSSWWVSRSNQQMDYWGGSLPGSRKCHCGLYGTCKDPSKWCNCDSVYDGWTSDKGELTQKEFLPVRQLRFGDTGSTIGEKQGRYTLGPLICEGDSLFDNVVTFRYPDATIDLPSFDMGHSGDIYFQFKTTAEQGVIVNSKGPTDFIEISIVGGDQIQFQYQAGKGPTGVSVETAYKLNDNNWHSILVERNRREARVVVDGSTTAEVRDRTGPIRALHLTSYLVIGATVDYDKGYVGCIRALMLNGVLVDLLGQSELGMYGVSDGCLGRCESSPCLNNATCFEGYSGYTCDCQWTAFKGPICADEIGVNLRSDNYVRYDFDTQISTLEEYMRVGFTTTEHRGLIYGVSSASGEYLNLVMSRSGHLRLVFDFGFERQEIIIKNENFALGQYHDIRMHRTNRGSTITIYVDNYEPIVVTFKVEGKADAQFNQLKSIYVGRNETMDTGEGFVGCISRVQFDDYFPLRRMFQENKKENVWAYPPTIREDNCGIEPVTHPSVIDETRPPPTLPPGVMFEAQVSPVAESAVLGGVLAIIFVALIIMAVIIGRYMSRHKGEYKTQEDKGAKDAPDADTAIMDSKTGHVVSKKKEWFI